MDDPCCRALILTDGRLGQFSYPSSGSGTVPSIQPCRSVPVYKSLCRGSWDCWVLIVRRGALRLSLRSLCICLLHLRVPGFNQRDIRLSQDIKSQSLLQSSIQSGLDGVLHLALDPGDTRVHGARKCSAMYLGAVSGPRRRWHCIRTIQ